jgi:hypothetical protein
MKKMGPIELAEKLKEFKKKYPNPGDLLDDFSDMRNNVSILIKTTTKSRAEVAKHLGITENSMYNKMLFPKRWKDKEIKKLINLLY